jgi:hypothetical protein
MQSTSKTGDCGVSCQEVLVHPCGHCNAWQRLPPHTDTRRPNTSDLMLTLLSMDKTTSCCHTVKVANQ